MKNVSSLRSNVSRERIWVWAALGLLITASCLRKARLNPADPGGAAFQSYTPTRTWTPTPLPPSLTPTFTLTYTETPSITLTYTETETFTETYTVTETSTPSPVLIDDWEDGDLIAAQPGGGSWFSTTDAAWGAATPSTAVLAVLAPGGTGNLSLSSMRVNGTLRLNNFGGTYLGFASGALFVTPAVEVPVYRTLSFQSRRTLPGGMIYVGAVCNITLSNGHTYYYDFGPATGTTAWTALSLDLETDFTPNGAYTWLTEATFTTIQQVDFGVFGFNFSAASGAYQVWVDDVVFSRP